MHHRPFLVFDGLLYRNKPSLGSLGVKPIRAVARFWGTSEPMEYVDEAGTRTETAKLGDYQGAVYIDIEHWPVFGVPDQVARENVAKLIQVADIVRAAGPNRQVGYYSVLPERVYWPIIQRNGAELEKWHDANRATEQIAAHVDVIFPSLYTFYNDPDGWETYARVSLKEARRYGKPIYVFLWPEFESNEPGLKDIQIPAEFWRRELAVCRELADGIVLWGGWQKEWDEQAPWWLETRAFLRRTTITSP